MAGGTASTTDMVGRQCWLASLAGTDCTCDVVVDTALLQGIGVAEGMDVFGGWQVLLLPA